MVQSSKTPRIHQWSMGEHPKKKLIILAICHRCVTTLGSRRANCHLICRPDFTKREIEPVFFDFERITVVAVEPHVVIVCKIRIVFGKFQAVSVGGFMAVAVYKRPISNFLSCILILAWHNGTRHYLLQHLAIVIYLVKWRLFRTLM